MAHRYFQSAHPFYCGVDLHARTLFVHVCDPAGTPHFAKELPAAPGPFLDAIRPFRPGVVVGVECMFAWYWVADLCEREGIPFVLGHALAMRAIHGGKSKNDRQDAATLAGLLRSGYFPTAYVYPKEKRDTRDLLRRRSAFVRRRAQLLTHIQLLNAQHNLPPFAKKLTYRGNRTVAIADRFEHPSTRLSAAADLELITHYDTQIAALELHLTKSAKVDDPVTFQFLRTIPGIGPILGLVLLYEIDAIARFPEVGNFLSYARLVLGTHESAGKVKGLAGRKMGNAHLKWAFSEAASLMLRSFAPAKAWMARQSRKRGTKKAHAVLEAKIGRTVYHLWKTRQAFDARKFLAS
jgi:transposase